MSTSLSIESLPEFRKPIKFGGTGKDPLWQIEDSKISGDIEAVQDSPTHVTIMPRSSMLLEKYETALAKTQIKSSIKLVRAAISKLFIALI